MKRIALLLFLSVSLLGCPSASSPTQPLAPGYSTQADQTLGQSLAAVTAFRDQERINYASLTSAQQAAEKPYLNALIDSVNVANTVYLALHAGTATLAQAQTAYLNAQTAQTNLTAAKGAK